jgi:hypothetical protein
MFLCVWCGGAWSVIVGIVFAAAAASALVGVIASHRRRQPAFVYTFDEEQSIIVPLEIWGSEALGCDNGGVGVKMHRA